MGAFERALAIGQKAGAKLTAVDLTYTRAGSDPVALKGSQGQKLWKTQEPGRPVVMVRSVDFLIQVADLVIDGLETEPQEMDLISRQIGSKTYIHKVLKLGRDIPFFSYSDTGQTMYRIHTKFLKVE